MNVTSSPSQDGIGLMMVYFQDLVLNHWFLSPGSLWGRVEEQSLWSSRQLGEHSPAALLSSLVYLNTKYFGLRTVEQHLRLSFANVYGPDTVHHVTKETTVCIRVPSISQDHHGGATGTWSDYVSFLCTATQLIIKKSPTGTMFSSNFLETFLMGFILINWRKSGLFYLWWNIKNCYS